MPKDLQVKACGNVDYCSSWTGLLCFQWYDKKPVTMLSTVHKSEMVTILNWHGQQMVKPHVVVDYNVGIRGWP